MSATAHLRTTAEVMDAIVEAMEGLSFGGEPLFGEVKRFGVDDLVEAFRYLLLYEQRIGLVIPATQEFERLTTGRKLLVRRTISLAVIASDRVLGNQDAALYGAEDTPGAYGLMDRILAALSGQLLANPAGVHLVPVRSEILRLTEADAPGRMAVLLEFDAIGGWLEATLEISPNL